ncbi:MAG TPA: methyltransferase domain-containing protein [Candidatus Binatia bacterium]|nr:methyltransferase domain-containing protein [Candidatus Binatia bacterium]
MATEYNSYYAWVNDKVIDTAINYRRPFEQRFIAQALELKPGMKMLEIGCNKGKFLGKLIAKGLLDAHDAYGIDVNEAGIAFAKKHAKGHYDVMDATKLAFSDGMFDRAMMIHVLEHIPNYKATLQELNRVLAKDGLLIITVPLDIFRPYLFKVTGAACRLLGLHRKKLDTRKFLHQVAHYLMNNPHVHVFRIKQLLRDFKDAGFTAIDVLPVCYVPVIPLTKPKPENVRRQPCTHDLLSYSATFVLRK